MSTPPAPLTAPDTELARFAQRALWALVATVAALAAAGAVLAGDMLEGPSPTTAAAPAQGTFEIAQDVPVSFGVIAVETAKKVRGLTKREVANSSHGISGFVPENKAELDLAVTMFNTTDKPIAWDVRDFRVRVGDTGKLIGPSDSSIQRGKLEPGATLDGTLRYIVPAKRERMRVFFKDPARTTPTVIDLGRVGSGARATKSRPNEPAKPGPDGHGH